MKAIIYTEYGAADVLRLAEIAKPSPQAHEVLIRIHAASLNSADWRLMRGEPFLFRLESGLPRPKRTVLGADIAGRVEAVGSSVTAFQAGDEVFADLAACGFGGLAEYVAVPADALTRKPAALTFEQAAAMPMAAVTAWQGLRDVGNLQSGQRVLIHGASGGVGTFAVQIASALGAEVTAVCSTRKVETVRSLGANHVIDYTKEDFAQRGEHYDVILAVNGNRTLSEYRRVLSPAGIHVGCGGEMRQIFQALLIGPLVSMTGQQKVKALTAKPSPSDLAAVAALFEDHRLVPLIDSCYPLAQVPDAMRYLESGQANGKVVISMQ